MSNTTIVAISSTSDKLYTELREKLDNWVPDKPTMTAQEYLDTIFEHAPAGDFSWEQEEALDGFAWNCEDKDCPVGWHRGYYYFNMGRKNGKCFVDILWDSDGSGDAQPFLYWEEGEDPTELFEHESSQLDNYFKYWARYWLDCYLTNSDVLKDALNPSEGTSRYLRFAERNIKYLYLRGVEYAQG